MKTMQKKHYVLAGLLGVSWMTMVLFPPWLAVESGMSHHFAWSLGYAPFFAPPETHCKCECNVIIDSVRLAWQLLAVTLVETLAWVWLTCPRPNQVEDDGTEEAPLQKQRLPRSYSQSSYCE